jgi:putative tryptophan/tyrosine transport system substrate-binding protein
MRRRSFLAVLGGAAAWPWTVGAQQRAMPVIGFLSSGSPRTFAKFLRAFAQGLGEQGFVEGRNVSIAYRWAEGHVDELDGLAAELVADHVALIAATGGIRSAKAASKATATIPIVFVIGFDPVQVGLVASFNRPGGNITGTSVFTTELAAKRLNLLYDLIPGIQTVAILVNPESTGTEIETTNVTAAARDKERRIVVLNADTESKIDSALAAAVEQQAGALLVSADPLFMTRRTQLVGLAAAHRMPAVYPFREFVDDGGLMSYGPSLASAYHKAGSYAGRILKGTKAGNLPIDLPTTFELLINLKTAQSLGLSIQPGLLAIADETIE